MDILFLIIGLAAGFFIGWFFAKKPKTTVQEDQAFAEKYVVKERFEDLKLRLTETEQSRVATDHRLMEKTEEATTWKQRHEALQQRLTEQKAELETLQERFKNDFKVLATEILTTTGKTFTDQNKTQLDTLLSPFREKLENFEKKVEETYEKSKGETISLKAEVKMLNEQSTKLGKEADNLAKALKGDVKGQGNWGEMILERVLERSGLTKNQEYFLQESHANEDGKRFQTDVLVQLPEGKKIIIDSKVSLVAYDRYVGAESPEDRQAALKELTVSLRAHVKGLSDKNYQNLYGIDGLDFVLLFVPIEGAFAAAVQHDQGLFEDAFDKNVVLVSTSTLLATLRTIASIWKQQKQTENAVEIARQAGDLYDKFTSFSEDLITLGKQMKTATGTYEESMKKLSEGKGNLVGRAEKLRELGIKTSKQMDQRLLDRSGNE